MRLLSTRQRADRLLAAGLAAAAVQPLRHRRHPEHGGNLEPDRRGRGHPLDAVSERRADLYGLRLGRRLRRRGRHRGRLRAVRRRRDGAGRRVRGRGGGRSGLSNARALPARAGDVARPPLHGGVGRDRRWTGEVGRPVGRAGGGQSYHRHCARTTDGRRWPRPRVSRQNPRPWRLAAHADGVRRAADTLGRRRHAVPDRQADRFLPDPPPSLLSSEWVEAYNEIKAVWGAASTGADAGTDRHGAVLDRQRDPAVQPGAPRRDRPRRA